MNDKMISEQADLYMVQGLRKAGKLEEAANSAARLRDKQVAKRELLVIARATSQAGELRLALELLTKHGVADNLIQLGKKAQKLDDIHLAFDAFSAARSNIHLVMLGQAVEKQDDDLAVSCFKQAKSKDDLNSIGKRLLTEGSATLGLEALDAAETKLSALDYTDFARSLINREQYSSALILLSKVGAVGRPELNRIANLCESPRMRIKALALAEEHDALRTMAREYMNSGEGMDFAVDALRAVGDEDMLKECATLCEKKGSWINAFASLEVVGDVELLIALGDKALVAGNDDVCHLAYQTAAEIKHGKADAA